MKNLFLILAVLLVGSIDAEAQKKKTYIKDVQLMFLGGGVKLIKKDIVNGKVKAVREKDTFTYCFVEDDKCEPRVGLKIGNSLLGTVGKDDQLMKSNITMVKEDYKEETTGSTYTTDILTTKNGSNEVYIGDFASAEEFELTFDLWEDDDFFGRGWKFDGSDDQYEDTITKASADKGHIKYVTKGHGCVGVSYTIVQK